MDKWAREAYVDWYIEQDKSSSVGEYAVNDTRFAGYCERRATHIRKLMLSFSASRGDGLILKKVDFDRALKLLTTAEDNMDRTFGGFGRARNSNAIELIKDYLQKVNITTRKMILQRFYRDVDGRVLTEIEETLMQMGCIKVNLLIKERDKSYEWIGE